MRLSAVSKVSPHALADGGRVLVGATILKVSGLRKAFGGNTVLDGVDLALRAGEVVLLRGENGSGKTTLLNVLSGNLQPDAGMIELHTNGHAEHLVFPRRGLARLLPDAWHFSPDRMASLGLGRSWQDVRCFGTMSLRENLAVAATGHPGERLRNVFFRPDLVRQFERRNLVEAAAELAGLGLDGRETSSADRISLGQSKRVAIARAVRAGARILLLDEPLSGLDDEGVNIVLDLLKRLAHTDRITLVVVEHALQIPRILPFADHVWTLADGKLTVQTPATVSTSHPCDEALSDWLASWGSGGLIERQLLPGGAAMTIARKTRENVGDVLLEVESLVINRGRRRVIGAGSAQLSFTLRRGDIALLQAPNGWGKTTLLECLAGLLPAAEGQVRLRGHPAPRQVWDRRRAGLRYLPIWSPGYKAMRVAEYCRLNGLACQGWMLPYRNRPISSLSGGERQRLRFQTAITAGRGDIVLYDEPLMALDREWVAESLNGLATCGAGALLLAQPGTVKQGKQ